MNRKSSSAEMEKLENMKIVELREYAKNLGLKGVSKLKKQELIEAVSDFIENEKSGKTEEVKNRQKLLIRRCKKIMFQKRNLRITAARAEKIKMINRLFSL